MAKQFTRDGDSGMSSALVVVRSFGQYKIGALINDPAQLQATLTGENAHNVVRVIVPGQSASSHQER
jgi:hypothetical protein